MPAPASSYVPQRVSREVTRGAGVRAWALLAGAGLSVCGLVLAAPLLAAAGYGRAAFVVYRAFAGLCHQLPDRSFDLAGHQLAVCARCAGVFGGFAAGVLVHPLARGFGRTDVPARRWLALAVLPTVVDFVANVVGLWPNTHWSRALTGALAGAGVAFFVLPGFVEIAVRRQIARRAPSLMRDDDEGLSVGGGDVGEEFRGEDVRVEGTRAAA